MPIGDWSTKTWVNGTDVLNATNMQRFEDRIKLFDTYCLPRYKRKAVDETINNTTTLQNDDELVVSLEASGIWEIELRCFMLGSYNSDFKCDWVVSGGATQYSQRCCSGGTDQGTSNIYDTNGNWSARDLNNANTYHGGNSGSYGSCIHEFFLIQTTTAGTVQFRWAQATAVAENTKVQAGSYIKVTKVLTF